MTIPAYIALIGWPFAILVIFSLMPGWRAAAIAVIGAWLFLPPYSLMIAGLPDYSKSTAAMAGMILGTLIFCPDRVLNFRPRWFDLPMLLFCGTGMVTSLQNGLGWYEGFSDVMNQTVTYGLPYLFGRLYFGGPESLRYFATAMAIGGLCYTPLCHFEMRMMQSLLVRVYGWGRWGSGTGLRWGGYRPNVFFWTGLELGLWMTAASLAAWWLWYCGALKKIGRVPFGSVLLPILMVTTILCRSTGAILLLVAGMTLLWLSIRFRTRLLVAGLLLMPFFYVAVRVPGLWSGQQAVDLVDALIDHERASSIEYRFYVEDLLTAKAVQQPLFGWGGWNRSHVEKQVGIDGLWIIFLGTRGFAGLTLFYLALSLPGFLFIRRFPARLWTHPHVAAGSFTTVLLGLYIIDCLLNGFVNTVYLTLAGGLLGLEPRQLRVRAARPGKAAGARSGWGVPQTIALGTMVTRPDSHGGRIMLADRYRSLGRSFKQEGRRDEALSAWRQALDVLTSVLEAEPNSPELRRLWCDCANDLVWLEADHPNPARRELTAAVMMARRMVEECPDAEVYWNTLGVACYRAGDDAAAIAALDRAATLGGGTAFDDVFLAMAHARLGDLERARSEFARALVRAEQDYPGHPELTVFCDEARSTLAQGSRHPSRPVDRPGTRVTHENALGTDLMIPP